MNNREIKDIIMSVILEDVGEKYLEKKHGIRPEFSEFDKQYKKRDMKDQDGQIIDKKDDNWFLIKNPRSLKNIGPSARGVILPDGDLYIESYGGDYIHHDILKILGEKGIIPEVPRKNWVSKLPSESGFLTVQRYKDSPYIAIGESNRLLYEPEYYNKYIGEFDEFLNRARSKNPEINFRNKLVGTKYLKEVGNNSHLMGECDLVQ